MCRRSSYGVAHNQVGDMIFEKNQRRLSMSSLPEVGGRPLTPSPLELASPFQVEKQRRASTSSDLTSDPKELEKKRIQFQYTTMYNQMFPHYGELAKPSPSMKIDSPARAKTAAEQRAAAEREANAWGQVEKAKQYQELARSGHLEKKLNLGITLVAPVAKPEATLHKQNYCIGSSSNTWKSELRANLDTRAHSSDLNGKYQQPVRLCVLAKYKNSSC